MDPSDTLVHYLTKSGTFSDEQEARDALSAFVSAAVHDTLAKLERGRKKSDRIIGLGR